MNYSLTRLSKGERLELKSGDEIYLLNPRYHNKSSDNNTIFMFFNIRERLFDKRERKPLISNHVLPPAGQITSHIEDFYIIGDQIGNGTCGVVHLCIHRQTSKHYAVKIIDTKKFALNPGLSPKELREEAEMMTELDHVSNFSLIYLKISEFLCSLI